MDRPEPVHQLIRAIATMGGDSSDYDLNPEVQLPPGRVLRPAAVLIPVTEDGRRLILTKRSARLKHHPGQIAFPGGKQDPIDATPTDAALREAEEEIRLPRNRVTVLGTLPAHETVTSFMVTPVIGLVPNDFVPVPEAGEVEEVFFVPLSHVTNIANFQVQGRRWQGRRRYYFTLPYGPYYIWGATARILRALADRMT